MCGKEIEFQQTIIVKGYFTNSNRFTQAINIPFECDEVILKGAQMTTMSATDITDGLLVLRSNLILSPNSDMFAVDLTQPSPSTSYYLHIDAPFKCVKSVKQTFNFELLTTQNDLPAETSSFKIYCVMTLVFIKYKISV